MLVHFLVANNQFSTLKQQNKKILLITYDERDFIMAIKTVADKKIISSK